MPGVSPCHADLTVEEWPRRGLLGCTVGGRGGRLPVAVYHSVDDVLPAVLQRLVHEGGVVLAQDDLGPAGQQQHDGRHVALPGRDVQGRVLQGDGYIYIYI